LNNVLTKKNKSLFLFFKLAHNTTITKRGSISQLFGEIGLNSKSISI